MVNGFLNKHSRSQHGSWTLELIVAIGILTAVLIPISFSFAYEMKLMRAYYYRAVLLEAIDGEIEVLQAGEWKAYQPGAQAYPISPELAEQLPPGRFTLTLEPSKVRLMWSPARRAHGGAIWREADLPGAPRASANQNQPGLARDTSNSNPL